MKPRIVLTALLLLASCAGPADFRPINEPGESVSELGRPLTAGPNRPDDDTMVALAFSGGGMRASAFSYGVLKSLSTRPLGSSRNKKLTDAVDFVSGVSGGAVTAAYFAWKGPAGYGDFREKFLDKNAEESLRTAFSIENIYRVLTQGGANDRQNLPVWLDKNVFHGATYAEVLEKRRPILWIGASDVYNRTPFVFSGITFRPLCSDLSRVRLADAVSASAAVPGAFTPINIESFSSQCEWREPAWVAKSDLYYMQQAMVAAFRRYRDEAAVKYIKLLDGGLTDNFGIQGVMLTRLSQGNDYAPLTKERAIRLKRMLFLVVNSGRGPVEGEWNRRMDNPDLIKLASAVSDTAIDSNVRVTDDFFKFIMREWNKDLIRWRCSLPKAEVQAALGNAKGWTCDGVKFFVTQVSFSETGPEREARLNNIPTRFVLPVGDIDFLIESADVALNNDKTFNRFMRDLSIKPGDGLTAGL